MCACVCVCMRRCLYISVCINVYDCIQGLFPSPILFSNIYMYFSCYPISICSGRSYLSLQCIHQHPLCWVTSSHRGYQLIKDSLNAINPVEQLASQMISQIASLEVKSIRMDFIDCGVVMREWGNEQVFLTSSFLFPLFFSRKGDENGFRRDNQPTHAHKATQRIPLQ